MRWIDKTPLIVLVMLTVGLGGAPFFPEPHLVEKLRMLLSGSLSRPVDLFDLLMHGTPLVLLAIKLWRGRREGRQAVSRQDP